MPDNTDALARAAAGGPVLELGLGTGRLALLMAGPVSGWIASRPARAMIARFRAQPGADAIGGFTADLAGFALPRRDYAVAVCAVSTLFMLRGAAAQQACISAAARHLRPGGLLFIEACEPDPLRLDARGLRLSSGRPPAAPPMRSAAATTQPPGSFTSNMLTGGAGGGSYDVTLRYADPGQIDAMAATAPG